METGVLKPISHIRRYCKWKFLILKHLREQQQALKLCTQLSGFYLQSPVTVDETLIQLDPE